MRLITGSINFNIHMYELSYTYICQILIKKLYL